MKSLILEIIDPQGKLIHEISLTDKKYIIGRDPKSDIIINDTSISKTQAALIVKFNQIYIENLSPLSKIFKNEKEVELAQLDVEDQVRIESFSLRIKHHEIKESPIPVLEKNEKETKQDENLQEIANLVEIDEPVPNPTELSFDEENDSDKTQLSISQEKKEPELFENEIQNENSSTNQAETELEINPPLLNLENNNEDSTSDLFSSEKENSFLNDLNASPGEPTKDDDLIEQENESNPDDAVTSFASVDKTTNTAHLKIHIDDNTPITKELNDEGPWIIGRSKKADIYIDFKKLSRKHFKIEKINNDYFYTSLSKKNIASIAGEKLKSTQLFNQNKIILSGLKIEFLTENNSLNQLIAGHSENSQNHLFEKDLALINNQFNDSETVNTSEKTAFLPPALQENSPFLNDSAPPTNSSSIPASDSFSEDEAAFNFKNENEKPQKFYSKYLLAAKAPQNRKKLIIGATLLLLVFVLINQKSSPTKSNIPEKLMSENKIIEKATSKISSQEKIETSFDLLSDNKKEQIINLHSKAKQSIEEQDWNTAFQTSSEILSLLKENNIDNYKDTKDILSSAQDKINEAQIGALSSSQKSTEEQEQEIELEVAETLETAEELLKEKKWDQAEKLYSDILVKDPLNEFAFKGLTAAQNRIDITQTNIDVADEPTQTNDKSVVVKKEEKKKEDPNQLIIQRDRELVQAMRKQKEFAQSKFHNGLFGEALPIYDKLSMEIEHIYNRYSQFGRLPASVQEAQKDDVSALRKQILSEREDTIKQLDVQYNVDLTDAESFVSNKDYNQAKLIYDRIVAQESSYTKPKQLRQNLYSLIIDEAKEKYQEALIYESIGKVTPAIEGFKQTLKFLENVEDPIAKRYYEKALYKLSRLEP